MKKKSSYRWLIWIILAVVLIGVALMHILPPYIDRWKSARDYDKLAEEYVNDESEPDDGKQKKKDWWATDVKVEFDKLKAENPDVIGWIRFDNQDELGINYPILYSGDNEKYLRDSAKYGNDYAEKHKRTVLHYDISTYRAKTHHHTRIVVETANMMPYLNPFGSYFDDYSQLEDEDMERYLFPIFDHQNDSAEVKFCRMT